MVAIRCTARLLARVGPPQEVTGSTTTVLGDWYAAPLGVNRQRFVLLISERSHLPVLMAGRDVKHLADNFPDALAAVLWGLGISAAVIQREVAATREAVIAKTNSRSLLGTLNDFSFLLKWQLQGRQEIDLVEEALRLSRTPVQPLRPTGFPDKVTRQLLGG
jgi:hypothetical protein